jgi:enediyne biosynthesis protein E4
MVVFQFAHRSWAAVFVTALICSGCRPADPSSTSSVAPDQPLTPQIIPTPVRPSDEKSVVLPVFQDVAAEFGIHAPFYTDTVPDRFFLPEIMGGGATWLDFDRDGRLDLYLTNGTRLEPSSGPPPRGNWLYRGQSDGPFTLVDESIGAADRGYGQGSAAGDFNSDGFPDLYVGNFGPNALYVNNGDGTFRLDTTSPVIADPAWTSGVLWIDLNRDGWLDLYVTNYLQLTLEDRKVCEYNQQPGYCGPGQYQAAGDHVYLNQGDGQFRDGTDELGMTDRVGKGLTVLGTDFNGDRIPEIYVGNDMTVNFLYTVKSSDPLVYEDVAPAGGCAVSGEGMNQASMGISCADFDGDNRPDLYLTLYYNTQKTLYRNHGDLQFEDVSRRMRTAQTGYRFLGFGTVPIDYDGDRFPDLFVTNGHVLGPRVTPNRMTPQWLHNVAGKHFEDVTNRLDGYFQKEWLWRGAASADFDNDGDLDIVVTHLDDPAALLQNSTPTGKGFIGFDLSTRNRIFPCGTAVTITTQHGEQIKSLMSGGSYLSSSDPRLLFVLEPGTTVVDVRIDWTSGRTDRFTELASNRYWQITEGMQPQ